MAPIRCAIQLWALCVVFLLGCEKTTSHPTGPLQKYVILEGYPADRVQALNRRDSTLAARARVPADSQQRHGLQSVMTLSRRWRPEQTVTVAFLGGTPSLRTNIARAIEPWAKAVNLRLDFGSDPSLQRFHEWSHKDKEYQAHIRIGFDSSGYWSFVGTEAIDPKIAPPESSSMNFEGFEQSLPQDWQHTVLHEFGHALGLQHEHQSPEGSCEDEFRWTDDPGYVPTVDTYGQYVNDSQGHRPGIYTVLGGEPNKWSRDQIDWNLRKLAKTIDLRVSTFDPRSIMKYYFEPWMFRRGPSSSCYSPMNFQLSQQDQSAVGEEYPRAPHSPQGTAQEMVRQIDSTLDSVGLSAASRAEITEAVRDQYRTQTKTSDSILAR
jgi:hypothetical protein